MSLIQNDGIKLFDTAPQQSVQNSHATPEEDGDSNVHQTDDAFRNLSNFKKFFTNCQCLSILAKRRFKNENMIVLSLIQVLCGLAAIIFSSIAINKGVFLYKMATGLWAGFIMIATGVHGLLTAIKTQVCTLISLLVWSILSSLTSVLLICVSIAGLIEDREKVDYQYIPQFATHSAIFNTPGHFNQVILHILLLIVGCLEASVGLSTAIFCCKTLCPIRSSSIKSNYSSFIVAMPDLKEQNEEEQSQNSAVLPYLYSNVSSFMPKSPENAVVLTHYDSSNTGAVIAAKATTAYLNHLIMQKKAHAPIYRNKSLQNLFNNRSGNSKKISNKNMKILLWKRKNIQTLNKLLKDSKETNLVYVMPSPNQDNPPTLFPPFPPTYIKSSRIAQEQIKITMNNNSFIQNANLGQLLHSLNQISSRNYSSQPSHVPSSHRRISNNLPASNRSPSSIYQINGDRILHPVLIIERNEDSPPCYPKSKKDLFPHKEDAFSHRGNLITNNDFSDPLPDYTHRNSTTF